MRKSIYQTLNFTEQEKQECKEALQRGCETRRLCEAFGFSDADYVAMIDNKKALTQLLHKNNK